MYDLIYNQIISKAEGLRGKASVQFLLEIVFAKFKENDGRDREEENGIQGGRKKVIFRLAISLFIRNCSANANAFE